MIAKEQFEIDPSLKGLLRAAVSSYTERYKYSDILSEDPYGKADAWKHAAKLLGCKTNRLRRCEVDLSDEQIEIFAEFAVTQAWMDIHWLVEWLERTSYSRSKWRPLMVRLFPPNLMRTERPKHNLALHRRRHDPNTPSVGQESLLNAMNQQASIILFVGEDGLGKTTALEELADRFAYGLEEGTGTGTQTELPDKHWMSLYSLCGGYDYVLLERRPAVNRNFLENLFNQILHLAKVPSFVDWTMAKKRAKVDELLSIQSALIILDQSTIEYDSGLIDWLQKLPFPSKAILSATSIPTSLAQCTVICNQEPLNPRTYPKQFAQFVERLVADLRESGVAVNDEMIRRIYENSEDRYNPGKIRMAALRALIVMGKQLDESLYFAPITVETYLKECYGILTEGAKKILFAMIPFPLRATPDALRFVARLRGDDGDFDSALAQLKRLKLVESTADRSSQSGYLEWEEPVSQFAEAQLVGSRRSDYLEQIYERWVEYYCQKAEAVGYCPYDHSKLARLDDEIEILPYAVSFVADNRRYDRQAIRLAKSTYYYYVRGLWSQYESPHLVAARAAHRLGWVDDEAYHLAFHVEWMTKRGSFTVIRSEGYLDRLNRLLDNPKVSEETGVIVRNTLGLYLIEAENAFNAAAEQLTKAADLGRNLGSPHGFIAQYRLGYCMSRIPNKEAEAIAYLRNAIQFVEKHGDIRTAGSMQILMAKTLLGTVDPVSSASAEVFREIEELLSLAGHHNDEVQDQNQLAHLTETRGLLARAQGDRGKARRLLDESRQLYVQLARPLNADAVSRILLSLN